MGVIADMARSKASAGFPGQNEGARLWRQAFGQSKEDQAKVEKPVVRGGSYGRSSISNPAAFVRLLQAFRSMAPGGWSDDRWEQSRHYFGMPYVAIHRQNELLSQAEFDVFIKDPTHPEGKREVTPEDPPQGDRKCRPYDLVKLLERPNNDDSFGDMLAQINLQLDLTGMALDWMVPNKLGTPMELYVVPTATAIPQPAVNPDYPDGYYRIQPIYPYGPFSSYPTPNTAVGAPIPAQWMLRIKYPHPFLRYDGYSPLTALRQHIDELEGMDRSRTASMRNGINPSAVLNFDEVENGQQDLPWEEIARIQADFQESLQGPDNAGHLYVSAPGSKLEPWGGRPMDMDYPAGWDQVSSFILGALGITKPAAGMVDDSSYSTLFATLKQLYWLTLDPKCNRVAQKFTRHLAPFFGDNLIIEIRCKRIDDHDVNFGKVEKLTTLKGMPKSAIRVALELMDIAPTPELVDELSEAGDEQGGGMPPGAAPPAAMPGETPPEAKPNPPEVEAARPDPGNLSAGALGPRKSINRIASALDKRVKQKSFYEQTVEVLRNGHYKK